MGPSGCGNAAERLRPWETAAPEARSSLQLDCPDGRGVERRRRPSCPACLAVCRRRCRVQLWRQEAHGTAWALRPWHRVFCLAPGGCWHSAPGPAAFCASVRTQPRWTAAHLPQHELPSLTASALALLLGGAAVCGPEARPECCSPHRGWQRCCHCLRHTVSCPPGEVPFRAGVRPSGLRHHSQLSSPGDAASGQLPASALGRQWMAQVLKPLPPMWEAQTASLVPGFNLALPQLVWAFEE